MTGNKPDAIVQRKFLAVFLAFVFAFITIFCGWDSAIAYPQPDPNICPANRTPTPLEQQLTAKIGSKLLAYEGCPEEMGAWVLLPMPEKQEDRMQAVHIALLPDNKVLIANGSSNRNRLTPEGKLEDGVDTYDYAVVNNTSIFDPSLSDPYYQGKSIADADFTTPPFTRISSPPSRLSGEPNDLFCSGHLHLPNGNVLFMGGTRFYYPGVKFQGSKQANLFHWQDQTWENLGLTEDGHWYPTLVPLKTGAIAAFSGLSAGSFDISPIVEIYDPNLPADKVWQHINIRDLPNSPFNTRMNDRSYAPDLIDLYPRILPTKKENQFLITGDGGGKDPLPVHVSNHSYFVDFDQAADGTYSISFEPGPDRKDVTKVYGTASLDPSSANGDVLLYGGITGTADISFGPGKYAIKGASIPSSLERWNAPATPGGKGEWEIDKDFLARIDEDILQDSTGITADGKVQAYPLEYEYVKQSSNLGRYGKRAMELAVILPTKQVLVVNGGNYAEHRPMYNPTLMTPDATKPQGFSKKLMNPDVEARLYHNTALLLPDARVLVMGGNPSRAARKADGTVLTNTIRDFEIAPPGITYLPAEIYQHAVFYPPYLFQPGERPEITSEIETLKYGSSHTISVSNSSNSGDSLVLAKLGSVTHSFDSGQRLVELEHSSSGSTVSFKAPTDQHFTPPGYYMLFYLNATGKPSHAKIVHLER